MKKCQQKSFDVVFGLGSACSCSETLRAAGLQLASFPLDWVSGSTLEARTSLVVGNFGGFLDDCDFERVENPGAFGHECYYNRRTGLVHPHDFVIGKPFDESFVDVRSKYDRRISRLLSLLERAHRVLVVWIGDPRDDHPISVIAMRTCLDLLHQRWPKVVFELRVFDCLAGVSVASPVTCQGEGFCYRGFDYRQCASDAKPWEVVSDLLVPQFSDCRVVDYRSKSERMAHRHREHERELLRFGAKSSFDLWLTKIQYRIYCHVRKSLLRRGMTCV